MSDPLSHDLVLLVEAFKAQGWQELRVETTTLSLLLSNDLATATVGVDGPAPVPTISAPVSASAKTIAPSATVAARDPSWTAIVAPNLGTFYRSPKPGSAPFVEVGDTVSPSTEICLLEVMKLFTSVMAGVGGVVREIVAQDAELVEGGQPLFYIEPQGN